ncbi:MAG: dihydrolipoyllysine-residue acetyltransferase [Melioribacteraceae bacterium]
MALEFKLPELGENIDQAEIVKVMVSVGDKIEVDQILLEIETDKATVEVPSEFAGIVKAVTAKDGDTLKIGDVVFTYEEGGSNAEATPKEEPKEVKTEAKVEETPIAAVPESTSLSLSEFRLPELGENIETAEVVNVLVKSGDKIENDQVVLEIETDKATVEVPSDVSGIVGEVKVKAGETIKVGATVFTIKSSGVSKTSAVQETKTVKQAEKSVQEKEIVKTVETKKIIDSADAPTKKDFTHKIAPAAPTARRFAREIGVDINEVNGNGPGGRISIADIKLFAKSVNEKIRSGGGGMPIGIKREVLPDFSKWGDIERKPMNNIRKKTAEHLSYAWSTIPHVTQFDKADITELEKMRKQFAKKAEVAGGKLTVTAILLKVVASAMQVFPQFNASIDMEKKEIIYKDYLNIGIAVDTEKGLIVPVVKDVNKKNILELSKDLTDISVKARNKKVTIEDMQGGCFTISNLGGIGGTAFTPIVNAPEVAILGVSRGKYEPVYIDGEFVPRMMLPLSLSYDHRIIDGADAARFIRWVSTALEQPFLLSLEG